MSIDLTILSVTYQSKDVIENYLNSLERQKVSFECLICDNNSKDGTVEVLRKNKNVKSFFMYRNRGYAKGNNYILKKCRGEIILLLNPDAYPVGNALERGIEFLKKREDVDILAPRLKDEDGKIYPSIRDFPRFYNLIFPFLWKKREINYEKEQEVAQPMASALFMRRKVYEDLKGFDERFFVYFTDVEFLKRARYKGYKILFTPEIEFLHQVGSSTKITSKILAFKSLEWGRGGVRYIFYHTNFIEKMLSFPLLWGYSILKSLFYIFF